ncbi:MAG: GGDEF domain-containing phosphodiesterase [Pseudomonadota bacterium]
MSQYAGRSEIIEVVSKAIETSSANEQLVCVISGKILRTKELYYELGYSHGDNILTDMCATIADCLREKDVFARIDNNEFSIVLPGLKNAGQPLMAVNKIQRKCGTVEIGKRELKAKFAFGASISPLDSTDPAALLMTADIALRHAEINNLDYVRYSDCPTKTLPPVLQMETELASAIEVGSLDAFFQPVIDVESGELTEIELITEWHRENEGIVEGALFAEIAKRASLAMPLVNWGLNNALRECSEWQSDLPRVRVAMNLSEEALHDPYLKEMIKRAMGLWGTNERLLSIEIDENTIMADPKLSATVLAELHDLGVVIAIDNFGTGASSLGYLKELPLDVLKIDRSFVTGMIDNVADRQIVQAVIDLAHNFDLSVVAKGVEDEETLDTLTLMGCQCAQGEHVGQPMAAQDILPWFDASPWEQLPDPNDTAGFREVDLVVG